MELTAARFRVRFFDLLDQVARTNEEIVITKHGRPVARVVPYRPAARGRRNGAMAGSVEVLGDIDGPCLPPLDGDAENLP